MGERNWDYLSAIWIGTRNYTGNGDVGFYILAGCCFLSVLLLIALGSHRRWIVDSAPVGTGGRAH